MSGAHRQSFHRRSWDNGQKLASQSRKSRPLACSSFILFFWSYLWLCVSPSSCTNMHRIPNTLFIWCERARVMTRAPPPSLVLALSPLLAANATWLTHERSCPSAWMSVTTCIYHVKKQCVYIPPFLVFTHCAPSPKSPAHTFLTLDNFSPKLMVESVRLQCKHKRVSPGRRGEWNQCVDVWMTTCVRTCPVCRRLWVMGGWGGEGALTHGWHVTWRVCSSQRDGSQVFGKEAPGSSTLGNV